MEDTIEQYCKGADYAVWRIIPSRPGCVDFLGTVYAEDLTSAEAIARLMYPVFDNEYLDVEIDVK